MTEPQQIIIKGARVHNLKNIDVAVPKNRLVVITGKSGSGKSSLAFDTIFAEGQRRYVESLSTYARQFLEQLQKPDVDSIEGLSPAIAIEQKALSRNPRSTVATITEIYDYLRVLYARAGTPYCYQCGREISSQTVQEMVDRIMSLPPGARVMVLAPIIRGRKGEFKKELQQLQKEGFVRVRIDGQVLELAADVSLAKTARHTVEAVVDRLVIKPGIEQRLADSLQTALNFGDGLAMLSGLESGDIYLNERLACIECGTSYPEISPRTFSFNSPYGACPTCAGLGTRMTMDQDLVVPDPSLTIAEGAFAPWANTAGFYVRSILQSLSRQYDFSLEVPFKRLPARIRNLLLHGSGTEKVRFVFEDENRSYTTQKPFEGLLPYLARRYHETESENVRDELARYMSRQPCPDCAGRRLRKESLAIKLLGTSIYDFTAMSVAEALAFVAGLRQGARRPEVVDPLAKEISERLRLLAYLGLDYLTLDRIGSSLSGGEAHRIRLATQLGTRLTGVLYVLDEPSVGLHARDIDRLVQTLQDLRDIGNTVIVVEHDAATIRAADWVIDLGPDAGTAGGRVVAIGSPDQIAGNPQSLTGQYLSGSMQISLPQQRRSPGRQAITIRGACANNLKQIDLSFPLGLLVCVTGVSGSGKSTLVIDTLYEALSSRLSGITAHPGTYRSLAGAELISKVINVDQSPIGRTPRSNPATFTGLLDHIREIFSSLPEARIRGYAPGRFSFNVKGGRCEACQGDGVVRIEMHFLPDVYVACDVCQGRRYNRETLEIAYRGKNIADVLNMTVRDALAFFENIPAARSKLLVLNDVGLGYLTLGQQATTLSGGEAQRLKLSRELSRKAAGHTLYILDEPTTGLHFADVHKLLEVLNSLVDRGNTVIVIEHNLEVIKCADHVIDLGPEGGQQGGAVVASGTPEEVARSATSYTGRYLRGVLQARQHSGAGKPAGYEG